MACVECRELSTHAFRSPDDLINALRVAAEEANRGVLEPIGTTREPGTAEQEAIYSALEAGVLPGTVRYRFRCLVCADGFTLEADMRTGAGAWTREEPVPGARA